MEEAIEHYSSSEEDWHENVDDGNDSDDSEDNIDYNDLNLLHKTSITAEQIIRRDDDFAMRLLKNFSVREFSELYSIID